MKKVFFYNVLILFLTLICFELLLRGLGFAASKWNHQQAPPSFDKEELRILIVGESTSTNFFSSSPDSSWPDKLRYLLSKGLPYKKIYIYNAAVPSINSAYEVRLAKEVVPQIKPHLMISMMGVNDNSSVKYSDTPWKDLKLYRLIKELKVFSEQELNAEFNRCILPNEFSKKMDIQKVLNDIQSVNDPIRYFYSIMPIDSSIQDKASVLMELSNLLRIGAQKYNLPMGQNKNLAAVFAEESFHLIPNCKSTVWISAANKQSIGDDIGCQKRITSVFFKGIRLSEDLLTQLGMCTVVHLLPESKVVLGEFHYESSEKSSLHVTFENYRELQKLAEDGNFTLYVLPYPLTTKDKYMMAFAETVPSNLPFLFTNFIRSDIKYDILKLKGSTKNVVFLENSSVFEESLMTHKTNDIFVDLFAEKFGHLSEYGAELLAKGVYKQLSQDSRYLEVVNGDLGQN